MINVLLVDDHVYIRKAIWYLMETTQDIKVVATASNGMEAVTAARFSQPDVIIMDISMPVMDGLDATGQILADFPDMRILMLSGHDDREYIKRAMEVGASGYILKESVVSELLEAIRSLYSGRRYFCRQILGKIKANIGDNSDSWSG